MSISQLKKGEGRWKREGNSQQQAIAGTLIQKTAALDILAHSSAPVSMLVSGWLRGFAGDVHCAQAIPVALCW